MSESNLADELAQGSGDAEKLIKASRQRYADGLGAAQLRESDESVDLDLGEVAKAAGVDKVISAAKRGNDVVFISEDKDGRTAKGIVPFEDLGKKSKPSKKDESKDEPKGKEKS